MGIKWSDIQFGVSPISNQIYIGKAKIINDEKGHMMFIDKSGDMTAKCINAVMEHFKNRCNDKNKVIESICLTIEGYGELIFTNLNKENEK